MKEDTTHIDPTWISKTGGYARDMTLRDYYAGLAMQAMYRDFYNDSRLAEIAYQSADAMLAAREAK